MKKRPPKHLVEVDPSRGPADALSLHIAVHGASAAAWLVHEFKGLIRVAGTFLLHLPKGKEMPTWCRVALEFLRRRQHGSAGESKWRVTETKKVMEREFKVEWLDWPRYSARGRVARAIRRAP